MDDVVRECLEEYCRRAKCLRTIHSNKAERATKWHHVHLVVSLVFAMFLSILGFVGQARLEEVVGVISVETFSWWYAVAVFIVLVIAILGLIFRVDERASRHYRSVESLTEFLRDTEDAVALSAGKARSLEVSDLTLIRTTYKGLLATLPPNTDKEHAKAKGGDVPKSERRIENTQFFVTGVMVDERSEDAQLELFTQIITSDPTRMAILTAVEDRLGDGGWVVGGIIRDPVWDYVHEYDVATPVEDVDVVFFKTDESNRECEHGIKHDLQEKIPNLRWSVKNEARMHVLNKNAPYESVQDAVSRFPETATAIAVQLSGRTLRVMAPHGLRDLFELQLRPSGPSCVDAMLSRMSQKDWLKVWPNLVLQKQEPERKLCYLQKMFGLD
ncbi:MAG: nucleotidyltransferase family protein [Propionibacteriaceae bacterium]|nr:nucleotidyltransferase family protein [Propionibacteriaceae bacterium]